MWVLLLKISLGGEFLKLSPMLLLLGGFEPKFGAYTLLGGGCRWTEGPSPLPTQHTLSFW